MNVGAKAALRSSSLFSELDSAAIDELAALAVNKRLAPGEMVFRQGEPGNKLYGVLSGRLRISAESPDGREIHLNMISPGEVVGEVALLDGGVRTATGVAVEPTTVCAIERNQFKQFLVHHPEIALGLIELLCQRVRWTSELLEDAAFYSLPVRLARRLNGLAAAEGGEVKISQTDLARFLNVSRQIVNGYLRTWQKEGQIELHRGRILVKDLSGVIDA